MLMIKEGYWGALVLLGRKKDESMKLCVNYRQLVEREKLKMREVVLVE